MACTKFLTLNDGNNIPVVGFGSFLASEDDIGLAINEALECGYRFFDCAPLYLNEGAVGDIFKVWLDAGRVTREDLFVCSKLPPTANRAHQVEDALKKSLLDLKLEYVDLYTIHVPFALQMEDVNIKRDKDGEVVCDPATDHVGVWKMMESMVVKGLTKSIGLSNFNQRQIEEMIPKCTIVPAILQIEFHIRLQQPELVAFCKQLGITISAFGALGSKWGLHVLQSGEKAMDFLDVEEVKDIAHQMKKTPSQILLRWIVEKGMVVTPKSTVPERISENIHIFDFELTAEFIEKLDSLNTNYRVNDLLTFKGINKHPDYPF